MVDIGKAIHKKRIENSLSLNDIASYLKISKKYVQAIEEGNIEEFVTDAYYQGYLKQYLKLLNLEEVEAGDQAIEVEHNSLEPIVGSFNPNFTWAISSIVLALIVYNVCSACMTNESIDPIALEYENSALNIPKIE